MMLNHVNIVLYIRLNNSGTTEEIQRGNQIKNGNIFNTMENRINLLSSEIGENSETE